MKALTIHSGRTKPMATWHLLFSVGLALLFSCVTPQTRTLQAKAEATKARIEMRHSQGKDVTEAVRLAHQVKRLGQLGKLEEADARLERINDLLDHSDGIIKGDGWRRLGVVEIIGYDNHAMEPFISRKGDILFFNNRNSILDNTDLHRATR